MMGNRKQDPKTKKDFVAVSSDAKIDKWRKHRVLEKMIFKNKSFVLDISVFCQSTGQGLLCLVRRYGPVVFESSWLYTKIT